MVEKTVGLLQKKGKKIGEVGPPQRRKGILATPGSSTFNHFITITTIIKQSRALKME